MYVERIVAPRVTIIRGVPESPGPRGSGYLVPEPWWAGLLRLASGMPAAKEELP